LQGIPGEYDTSILIFEKILGLLKIETLKIETLKIETLKISRL